MSVTRRATFRLYPKPAQEKKLFEWKRLHCYLYNACVEQRRTSYQRYRVILGLKLIADTLGGHIRVHLVGN